MAEPERHLRAGREASDERGVLGMLREQPLDHEHFLEAFDPVALGPKYLRQRTFSDAFEELVATVIRH